LEKNMAAYIYARVSTDGQTTDGQALALRLRFPDAQLISEVASGAKSRPMLRALVDQLRVGDQLIVAALDRLGRRTSEVLTLIEDLERRGIVLISIREGVDYSTPVGRLVTQILVSVAEMERSMIGERTRAGLAAARAKGSLCGRPRVIGTLKRQTIEELAYEGISHREIARRIGVSPASVGRLLRAATKARE
jgi:DNA invertase Pin-like site-specific DNA recombinase